jgi:hypothetical protein
VLLRWLDRIRLDIAIGPAFIGRYGARWMLDAFLPERGRYISPAIPAFAALPDRSFPVEDAAHVELALARMRAARTAARRQDAIAALDAYLHRNPDVMRAWQDGWPGGPPGAVR